MDKYLKEIIRKWHIKAENDIATIENLFKSDNVITDSICFHAQQAVEKYLKSYLVSVQSPFKNTHNITSILKYCSTVDNDFQNLEYIVFLNSYAVELRYPDDFYIPDINEAIEAYETALKVKEFVLKKIQSNVDYNI